MLILIFDKYALYVFITCLQELGGADKELCLVRKDPKLFSALKQQAVTKVKAYRIYLQ